MIPSRKRELRTPEQVRKHYEVEKELASRLLHSSRDERRFLYSAVYNELFRRLPDHPQLTQINQESRAYRARRDKRFLDRFLSREAVFLEIGAGDCALGLEAAQSVRAVFCTEVSEEIVNQTKGLPENLHMTLSDGVTIPVKPATIDVAFSTDVIEHLHPDDLGEHLAQVFAALKPGGVFVCFTPHRLSGPHDISGQFDDVATGLHLREYSVKELSEAFRAAGFESVRNYVGYPGPSFAVPSLFITWWENLVGRMPMRRTIARNLLVRATLGICMAGTKPLN